MSDKSTIEWTQATWNCVVGCARVSSGCAHCYAIRDAYRMASNPNATIRATYAGLTVRHGNGQLDWTGTIRCLPERLDQPLRWREPRRIFVNSMSDLFHPDVPVTFIRDVFAVMGLASRHTFQVLTKRPERMAAVLNSEGFGIDVWLRAGTLAMTRGLPVAAWPNPVNAPDACAWPLPNCWVGTSVEDQAAADERIPFLLHTPATVRFLSCEPLLGPVNLEPWLWDTHYYADPETGEESLEPDPSCAIDWVIAGAESGHKVRPMDEAWVRSLRDQCTAAEVPFFYKQNAINGKKIPLPPLDGRVWQEMPEVESCTSAKEDRYADTHL